MSKMIAKTHLWLIYAERVGFSGQWEASRLIFNGLGQCGWKCRHIEMPALKDRKSILEIWAYSTRLIVAWCRCCRLLWCGDGIVHVSIGQTGVAMIRDSVPILLARFSKRKKLVIGLHGSNFMTWPINCAQSRLFVRLLNFSHRVAVLGERQRQRAFELGVRSTTIIVPNACEAPQMSINDVLAKHSRADKLHILYLSSLIASKGYPNYLDALCALCGKPEIAVEAVLCGTLLESQFAGTRFNSLEEASAWISMQIEKIEKSNNIRVRWIRGAVGHEKWALFKWADVFVFPSTYKVEAQPIVILEAIALGSVVVTTNVGEISSVITDQEAILLSDASPEAIVAAILKVSRSSDLRKKLSAAAHARYEATFSKPAHLKKWDAVFRELLANG
jgi:glycosyltransferase involved in cell wall biosynthesis